MPDVFEFATATRILFGCGTRQQLPSLTRERGKRVFIVTGRSQRWTELLLAELRAQGLSPRRYTTSGEPTVTMVNNAVQAARDHNSEVVLGIGGGSVIDTGKAVAALLTNREILHHYLEVVGDGQPITQLPAPYIAVPTTAGTGAEVTCNAVLSVPEHRRKVSMRSPLMLPSIALIDPELTYHLPPEITAYTGLDALTQVIEPFVSRQGNPLTDTICRDGIRRGAKSLRRAFADPDDIAARYDMALTSLYGGLALANAKLGAVHGLAGPLGGEIAAPHGAICGQLLPYTLFYNIQTLNKAPHAQELQQRFDELGQLLTGQSHSTAHDGVTWLQQLCQDLNTKPLSTFGLNAQQIPDIAVAAAASSSMRGNPVTLSKETLVTLLHQAL